MRSYRPLELQEASGRLLELRLAGAEEGVQGTDEKDEDVLHLRSHCRNAIEHLKDENGVREGDEGGR